MAAHVLVVATVTATSDDLLAALRERADRSSVPVDFTLVMPAAAVPWPRTRRSSRRRSRAGATRG